MPSAARLREAHPGPQLSLLHQWRLRILLGKRSKPRLGFGRLFLFEQQDAPMEAGSTDVVWGSLDEGFQTSLFFRLILERSLVLQSLLGQSLLLVITLDNGIVQVDRFVTLIGHVMDTGQQILGMDTKHRIEFNNRKFCNSKSNNKYNLYRNRNDWIEL